MAIKWGLRISSPKGQKKVFNNNFAIFAASKILGMSIQFTGIITALCTFVIIGFFHPIVIKVEYYTGTKLWWLFLLIAIACATASLFIQNILLSTAIGVVSASSLWSIGELFKQRKRVLKGWFPMNPKRKHEYEIKEK